MPQQDVAWTLLKSEVVLEGTDTMHPAGLSINTRNERGSKLDVYPTNEGEEEEEEEDDSRVCLLSSLLNYINKTGKLPWYNKNVPL